MESIQKFQDLLKRLFQFETSDLDFGIYRILNYKRDRIEKFIQKDLKNKVETAFTKHKGERLTNINQRFEEAKQELLDTAKKLGKEPLTPTGDLKDEFKDSELGREYLSLKAQKDEAETIDEIKLQVFNDLYNFFSRYYEEGDFVPQYRYSIKGHKYAIPYNGEEVKLYWANSEQYYTKTGLLFRDYTFKAGDFKVIFRIVSAIEELGSKKATKQRFFILDDSPREMSQAISRGENPVERTEDKVLIIRFQYRELTEKEVKSYGVEGGSNTAKQEKINQKSFDKILERIEGIELKVFLSDVIARSEATKQTPLLLYQISRFTAKNTKDYFIHKNLKKFLSEQLDYFIKAEVLDIETLEKERFLDSPREISFPISWGKHITRAKVVREIGESLIDFLSQIEDFQKKLWEKKKFVLKTEYVITTDRVPEEFYKEIWKNEEQKKEWKELGFVIARSPERSEGTPKQSLKNLHLPIDTKYFSQEFKEKLLEKLTEKEDLDDLLDGLLIKSENWQALNLILGKYKEKVQAVYIDPPFNLGTNADFLYNVNYKDSTWISILENRLELAKIILDDKGSIFVRCDYNGNMYVRMLMNEVLGYYRNEIILSKSAKVTEQINRYHSAHDSLFFYTKTDNYLFRTATKERPEPKWRGMHLPGVRWSPISTEYVKLFSKENLKEKNGKIATRARIILGKEMLPPEGRHWALSQEAIFELEKDGKIKLSDRGEPITQESDVQKLTDNWTDWVGYSSIWGFSTENHEKILERVIFTSSANEGDIIMDFFLGSGTTTAVAHKLKRKWIGVEMGEHFWTVVLPRMKKVLVYDKSGISKEKDVKERYNEKAAGGFFKYQILEQYEDTLDNIELRENKQAQLKFGDDYLLKYFLDYETRPACRANGTGRENPSLLNIEKLKNPFSYKLKVNLEEVGSSREINKDISRDGPQKMIVDIPETFNYLLGLKVKKIHPVRCLLSSGVKARNNSRKYLFIHGEKEGKDIAIVWREYEDKWSEDDFKKDKNFIIKELEAWTPHIVYVNGQSVLTPKLGKHTVEIRYIEPEFKNLMG